MYVVVEDECSSFVVVDISMINTTTEVDEPTLPPLIKITTTIMKTGLLMSAGLFEMLPISDALNLHCYLESLKPFINENAPFCRTSRQIKAQMSVIMSKKKPNFMS
eukprot:TRINITY_DN3660_c0_g3_i2.p1 TRINITY_DN3660_c0_g3~~TRINITY_DN3660_c0_g3_i2.p1  ORF type:complete len:106 (-),score=24.14 TRINITY_DN3660_c0_g3_i2:137-454(-)